MVKKDTLQGIAEKKELLAKEVNHATISSVSSVDSPVIWLVNAQKKELITTTEELLVKEVQFVTILSAISVVSPVIWHAIVQTLLMKRVWQGFSAINVGKMDTLPKIALIRTPLMKRMVDNAISVASQAI